VSSYGFVKKSGRIWKPDRYFESCSLWAPIFRDPCDQVALLNALKENGLRLSMRGRAPQAARRRRGAGAYGTRASEFNSIWSVIVPADGTRTATVGNGDFGTSPLLLGSSRTSRCLPVFGYVGVSDVKNNGGLRNYALI
jgi:hypothetical protein